MRDDRNLGDIYFIRREWSELLESLDIDSGPLELEKYWARKKNRMYLSLSDESAEALLGFFSKRTRCEKQSCAVHIGASCNGTSGYSFEGSMGSTASGKRIKSQTVFWL